MKQVSFELARQVSKEQGTTILSELLKRLRASPCNKTNYQPPKITDEKKVRI